jgi:regulatory protein
VRGSRRGPGRSAEAPPPGPDDVEADPASVARAIALRQLAAAPRSRAQLEKAMAQRDVPDDVAAAVLDRFTEVNLVDDAAYAEMLVRSQQASRGLARRGLAHELRAKGIDDETAAAALEQVDPEEELATARALVARRLPATARLERAARVRRLAGMLARKGYPSGLALRVVQEAIDAAGDSQEADDPAHDGPLPDDEV